MGHTIILMDELLSFPFLHFLLSACGAGLQIVFLSTPESCCRLSAGLVLLLRQQDLPGAVDGAEGWVYLFSRRTVGSREVGHKGSGAQLSHPQSFLDLSVLMTYISTPIEMQYSNHHTVHAAPPRPPGPGAPGRFQESYMQQASAHSHCT